MLDVIAFTQTKKPDQAKTFSNEFHFHTEIRDKTH